MPFDKNHTIRIKGDGIARMYAITVNNSIRKINKYKQTNPYHICLGNRRYFIFARLHLERSY